MKQSAVDASNLLRALGNEHRLLILCHVASGEKSVTELQGLVGLRQSALSQHLARLRRDGFVTTRREAQTIYYSVKGQEAKRLIDLLYELYCGTDGVGEVLEAARAAG